MRKVQFHVDQYERNSSCYLLLYLKNGPTKMGFKVSTPEKRIRFKRPKLPRKTFPTYDIVSRENEAAFPSLMGPRIGCLFYRRQANVEMNAEKKCHRIWQSTKFFLCALGRSILPRIEKEEVPVRSKIPLFLNPVQTILLFT